MSLRDYVSPNAQSGEITREVLARAYAALYRQSVVHLTCLRCGYETDSDDYCVFCGHLNVRPRPTR